MKAFEGPVESPPRQLEPQPWDLPLAGIVQALRERRETSARLWRSPRSQRLLPSAKALRQVMDGLSAAPRKSGVLSFTLAGHKPEDVGSALDQAGIAVRAGHHCAQPIHRRFGLDSTVRATLGIYNTRTDIDALVAALRTLVL